MKFVNTEKKYSPQSIEEFVFSDEDTKELVTAYASGHIERPLILHGVNGSGKSLLQTLIPNAIENRKASLTVVKCADLKNAGDIHDLYGRNKHFNRNFRIDNQKFNYIIFEEFYMKNSKMIDALKIELDQTLGTDLTIMTTNHFNKIDYGIVSRSEVLEINPCKPIEFLPYAKKIFQNENNNVDDDLLLSCLEASQFLKADNRKYYSAIDSMFRKI